MNKYQVNINSTEINEKPIELTPKELYERFAEANNISIDEAEKLIGGNSSEQILNNISRYTLNQIRIKNNMPLNRAQRRALAKKAGKSGKNAVETVTETATKLNYIDLIQKLRKLNEKKEKEKEENGEDANEND